MKRCKKCDTAAVIQVPAIKASFCQEHFCEFVKQKVKKTIFKDRLINPYERIAVALSGGKDSAVLMHILDELYAETLELIGIHINLGISPKGYSKESLQLAKNLCKTLGREFLVVNLKEQYQISMDLVKENERAFIRPLCGICGTIKRYLLNKTSLLVNCEKLATGHVLDDEVSVLFTNLLNGNISQLIRTGPLLLGKKDLMITRIKPLYEISEKETTLYAQFTGLPLQETECPFSKGATSLKYKRILGQLETSSPGIENSLLQNFNRKILPALKQYYQPEEVELTLCQKCQGPTVDEICAFCKLKAFLSKQD
ncbi:MAG: TIGR00269 family protein [Candidatus Helarchaeota archaeon]